MATSIFGQNDEVTIRAWFTTEIGIPIAPTKYAGLPGAILFLEVPHKRTKAVTTFAAKEIKISQESTELK